MTGHLFLTRSDLLQLHCDAILIPSGTGIDETGKKRYGHLVDDWAEAVGKSHGDVLDDPPDDEHRIVRVREAEKSPSGEWTPEIWAAHSGDTGRDGEWYAEPISAFIREFAARTGSPVPRPPGSDRLLIGVPLLGAGRGGMADAKGEVMTAIMKALVEGLRSSDVDVDVVLVLFTGASYAAAQEARSRYLQDHGDEEWPELSAGLQAHAAELAKAAEAGRLVLFMGAGVSMGAGLPSWNELLEKLAGRAKLSTEELAQLRKLDARDAGAVLEKRLGKAELRAAIEALVGRTHVSLLHQILASLPVDEALTTNYDVLFETAWRAAGRKPAVLPMESRSDAAQWLVKLHGSVSDPKRPGPAGNLVLSRDDYLNFETASPALAGIVQAMLLTRQLLFVGYSLTDENFHRIAHQVRATVEANRHDENGTAPFGTVLTEQQTSLVNDLWEGDLEFISTHGAQDDGAIRRIAIFLDLLAASTAARAEHLMLDTFESVFNGDEQALRKQLKEVQKAAQRPDVRPGIQRAVEDALERFGAEPIDEATS